MYRTKFSEYHCFFLANAFKLIIFSPKGHQLPPVNIARLSECYRRVVEILGEQVESFEVVRAVEAHRWYWRPETVSVILLAESHVYTQKCECILMKGAANCNHMQIPRDFVRLVYCLGYGETEYIGHPIAKNTGTPQFWKIFASCAGETEFSPYLKSRNRRFEDRIRAKVTLLEKLRRMGVWLLDASIVGLYRSGGSKPNSSDIQEVIETCWDLYLRDTILGVRPKKIIVIGKGVGSILENRLNKVTGCNHKVLPQPQARLSKPEHQRCDEAYRAVCSKYCCYS